MISNVYETDDGRIVIAIGLTHAELMSMIESGSVLDLKPADGQEAEDPEQRAPSVVLFANETEEGLDQDMVNFIGQPGRKVEMKDDS